ncbi:sce7726 family protein [Cobetia amphilecti]|uniref:sce7726 family protein n=1 Tax=Cobetia amphilecti TaxID=1055104 RepID=UPI000A057BA2|nr:sce7726 family protein [Cobetia amphilecti]
MPLTSTQASALSRMFSSGVFKELARKGRSPLFTRLVHESGLADRINILDHTIASTFDLAFSELRKSGVRDEYVYRSALTQKILLGRHSLRTASMLTEFRAGSSRADLVVLNGKASAYEIKSDRDSLSRLNKQIADYRKVFSHVYVIASHIHLDSVIENTPEDVGIMSLVRWNRIHTAREAVNRESMVCTDTIFQSLRMSEAKKILTSLDVKLPDVPNIMLWEAMREKFSCLKPIDVHRQMIAVLKESRNLASLSYFVEQMPISLQAAALSITIGRADHDRLIKTVRIPLFQAMDWE